MVVNNWFIVVDMHAEISGNPVLVRIFFVSFWVIIVLILLNIMIAVVIEIHGSFTDEAEIISRRIKSKKMLYKMLREDDPEVIKSKLAEAARIIEEALAELDS